MKNIMLPIVLIALVGLASATNVQTVQSCQACQNCNCDGVPVNQPIIINTPPTIAPPACATPDVNPPVIAPPTVNIPTIDPLCLNVPTLTPPNVVPPPTVTPPKPIIPIVRPPTYTPPTLPPQVPPPTVIPTLPPRPNIPLPPRPTRDCDYTPESNQFTLSFSYVCRNNVPFQSCLGEVVWNNFIIYSIIPTDYSVQTRTLTVTALVGRNTLQFSGAGTSDSFGLLIDDARLIRGSVDIVVNGDFQLPNVPSWGLFTDISGWRGYEIEIGKGNAVYGLLGSTTNQVCELDGNRNYQITQTFLFDSLFNFVKDEVAACPDPFPGQSLKYRLEFDWAVRTVGINNFDSSKANVLWNDYIVGSLQYSGFTGVSHASFDIVLKAGQNTLQFDGTSFSDSYGITIDNVKVFSIYNSTNLVVNGDFALPNVGSGWQYLANGLIPGWSAVTGEIGHTSNYNPSWGAGQVLELDSTENQRYTQVITIAQSLYDVLLFQVKQIVGNAQVTASTNLAIQNGQAAINSQLAQLNSAVQCSISLAGFEFNNYLQSLYQCNAGAIQYANDNKLFNIKKYSCGASEWIKYFGNSGELDFQCGQCYENELSKNWCTIISINGKVIKCRGDQGYYNLQIAPCSHFEGTEAIPQPGHKIFWQGLQGSTGNVYVTIATTCSGC